MRVHPGYHLNGLIRDFPTFVRWYQQGQLNLDDLVTQRYTLEQINDAVAALSAGRIHGRSIIMYE